MGRRTAWVFAAAWALLAGCSQSGDEALGSSGPPILNPQDEEPGPGDVALTLTFNVTIVPDETTTYKTSMKRN